MCDVTGVSELTLDLDEQASARARRFLGEACCDAHHGEVSREGMLLVSELVTNAVRHGLPPVRMRVECEDGEALRVGVADANPQGPVLRDAGADDESGRGMRLVDLISDQWGVENDENGGKQVWFRIRVLSTSGS